MFFFSEYSDALLYYPQQWFLVNELQWNSSLIKKGRASPTCKFKARPPGGIAPVLITKLTDGKCSVSQVDISSLLFAHSCTEYIRMHDNVDRLVSRIVWCHFGFLVSLSMA